MNSSTPQASRRDFLTGVCALSATAASMLGASQPPSLAATLPQMPFGRHSLSRLICGANPFNGGSHLSTFVNQEMRRYYTPEQILKSLRRCQEVGINCWQSANANFELYRRFRDEGGTMHYISLGDAAGRSVTPEALAKVGCIAIAHHGEVTDRLFKSGELDKINDYLKRVHDNGMMAGVSTHMPDVVDAIESKGWAVDFYMTCVYERHRTAAELEKLLGHVPIPVGEVYLTSDPPRMYKAVRATKRPCLAFKVLAAGRLSERREWVEQAFRQAYDSIKPGDGVIVGIYDKFADQQGENASFVKRFTKPS